MSGTRLVETFNSCRLSRKITNGPTVQHAIACTARGPKCVTVPGLQPDPCRP
jgi:hypothetical protein